MFGNSVHGNERAIAEAYVNKIGGDAQLQQIFEVLLNEPPEAMQEEIEKLEDTIEKLEESKDKLEDDLQELQERYDELQAKWESIDGDAFL